MYSTQTHTQALTQTHKTMWWGYNRTLRKGGGLLYHLWQGGNRPITNDSRCLNTMSIFDGKDGSSHPSFQSRPSCWFHFHFDKMFFSKVEPPTTKLNQQTTNIYASMSLLYPDSVAYMPASHRIRDNNIGLIEYEFLSPLSCLSP